MRQSDYMKGEKPFGQMTADHLMEKEISFFEEGTAADRLMSAMVSGNFGSVPIVNQERVLIGIVSESDLLEAILSGADLTHLKALEIMKHPHAISINMKAMDIARFLQRNDLIRVPVVNEENRLVGVVARRDLLMGLLEAGMAV